MIIPIPFFEQCACLDLTAPLVIDIMARILPLPVPSAVKAVADGLDLSQKQLMPPPPPRRRRFRARLEAQLQVHVSALERMGNSASAADPTPELLSPVSALPSSTMPTTSGSHIRSFDRRAADYRQNIDHAQGRILRLLMLGDGPCVFDS